MQLVHSACGLVAMDEVGVELEMPLLSEGITIHFLQLAIDDYTSDLPPSHIKNCLTYSEASGRSW